jgi:predicted nicotinamide N-methyase
VLWTTSDATPLWEATEQWLRVKGVSLPFWAFPWAGGQALARYVFDTRIAEGLRVLDLGAGSGLVGIACARAGARSVVCADIDALACAATRANATENGVSVDVWAGDAFDGNGALCNGGNFDLIVAADLFYERPLAERVFTTLAAWAARGARVLLADPERTYGPHTYGTWPDDSLHAPSGSAAAASVRCTPVVSYRVPTTHGLERSEQTTTVVWSMP